jgi:phage FluMu protein Com
MSWTVEKKIKCEKCGKVFVVTGPDTGSRELPYQMGCPNCKHLNKVSWATKNHGTTSIPNDK